jgi:transcriptional regulator with GAF, ATPase, and Fis domain
MNESRPAEAEGSDVGAGRNGSTSRMQQVAEAFTGVADAFSSDVDALVLAGRLVDHCVALTAADAAGLLLVDARGRLRSVSASDPRVLTLDRSQAQTGEGPGVHAWQIGEPFLAPRLGACAERWPRYTELAAEAGVRSVCALPVTVRDQPVGALNLLMNGTHDVSAEDLALAAALADVAVGAMLRWRADPLRPSDIATRVQAVISSTAVLETAVGMLVARHDVTVADAEWALEDYARRNGSRPAAVAQQLLERLLPPGDVLTPGHVRRAPGPRG